TRFARSGTGRSCAMLYANSPLAVVARGAAAGLVGTAALTFAMPRVLVALREYDLVPPEAPVPRSTSQAAEAMGIPPEKLADKVATGVLEKPLPGDTREKVGEATHWGYGAA